MNLKQLFAKAPAPPKPALAATELEFLSRFLSPRLVESEKSSTLFKTLVNGGYLEDCSLFVRASSRKLADARGK
jgi:hypothetical protein